MCTRKECTYTQHVHSRETYLGFSFVAQRTLCSSLYFPAGSSSFPFWKKPPPQILCSWWQTLNNLHPLKLVKKLHKIHNTRGFHIPFIAERATTRPREQTELYSWKWWINGKRCTELKELEMSQNHRSFTGEDFKKGTKHKTKHWNGEQSQGQKEWGALWSSSSTVPPGNCGCHFQSESRGLLPATWGRDSNVGISSACGSQHHTGRSSCSWALLRQDHSVLFSATLWSAILHPEHLSYLRVRCPTFLPFCLTFWTSYPGKKRTTSATQKSTSPFSTFHIQLLAMKWHKCNLIPLL